jgi:hypothetical protein
MRGGARALLGIVVRRCGRAFPDVVAERVASFGRSRLRARLLQGGVFTASAGVEDNSEALSEDCFVGAAGDDVAEGRAHLAKLLDERRLHVDVERVLLRIDRLDAVVLRGRERASS